MRFLWSQHPDIAQNKADEMKAAGKSLKKLPTYAHGEPEHPEPFHKLKNRLRK